MVGKKCIRGDCRIGEGCLGVLEPFAQLVESMLHLNEPTFKVSFNKFRSTRKFSDRMKIEVELASQVVTVRGNKSVCVCVYAIFQNNTVLRSLSF